MTVNSLRKKWAELGIGFSLNPCGKDVIIEAPDSILTRDLVAEIRKHKPKIINWLQNQQKSELIQALPAMEETKKTNAASEIEWHSLNALSSAEIIRYRLLLEASYRNPANDVFHGEEMPQRFREGNHTFEDIEKALERFIPLFHQENQPEWIKNLAFSSLVSNAEQAEQINPAIESFIKASEKLREYQAYQQAKKILNIKHHDEKIKKVHTSAWNAWIAACTHLPQYEDFIKAKIDQYEQKRHAGFKE